MDKVIVNYKIINGKMVSGRTIDVDGEIWCVTEFENSWSLTKKDDKTTFRLNISKNDCENFEGLAECVKNFYKGN